MARSNSACLMIGCALAALIGLAIVRQQSTDQVDVQIGLLRHPEWGVREAAAEALGRLGDARAVQPLIRCVREGDADLRTVALEALLELRKPAVEPLIGHLHPREREVVRERAAQALGNLGTREPSSVCSIVWSTANPVSARQPPGRWGSWATRAPSSP